MASAAPASGAAAPLGLAVLVAAAAGSAALLLWAVGDRTFAAAFFAGALALGVPLLLLGRGRAPAAAEPPPRPDLALVRAALDALPAAAALTDSEGRRACANAL